MTMTTESTVTRVPESVMEKYARQTRNSVVTLAVLAVLGVIASFVFGLLIAVAAQHTANQLGNPSPSPTCASQGGYDLSC